MIVLDIVSWVALVAGGFFCLVGAIGLNRFPDIFTRLHATSVSDTLGVGFLILGMLLQSEDWTVVVRLLLILLVLLMTGPVAGHALARAALHDGQKPLLADADGNLVPTDCGDIDPELKRVLEAPMVSEMVVPEEQEAEPSKS